MESECILSLLREQVEVLYSWGFSNEVIMETGLQFSVQGFLFNGKITVLIDSDDSFTIRLNNPDGSLKVERVGILSNELVAVIDTLVEKNCSQEEYEELVLEEYEGQ